jgi:hypothetical protein
MQLTLIAGAQRSGTTLLQTLLANALDSTVLPEVHILSDILAAFKRAKESAIGSATDPKRTPPPSGAGSLYGYHQGLI